MTKDINVNERDTENCLVVDGRKYHPSAAYPLPHDEGETKRLSEQHGIFREFLGANYFAPVTDVLNAGGAHVLDSGCGPGVWTLDMAETFPKNHFYGTDLSPRFMQAPMSNVTFTARDVIVDGLPYPDATFNFAYSRLLLPALSIEQWRNVYIPELIRVLKPGAWVEFHEARLEENAGGSSWKRLAGLFNTYLVQNGMDASLGYNLPRLLESTGQFTDIKCQQFDLPIGPRGGKLGEQYLPLMVQVFEGCMPKFAATGNMTFEEYHTLLESYATETAQADNSLRLIQVYARKK